MGKHSFVLALWLVTQPLTGCGGGGVATPAAPSPVATPQPPPPTPSAPETPVPRWPAGYTLTAVSLSGTVYEITPSGRVPIPAIRVYCELCGTETHQFAVADANGFYIFPGDISKGGGIWLAGRRTPLLIEGQGYKDPEGLPFFQGVCPRNYSCREVFIEGDTHFDIELIRIVQ